MLLMKRFAPDGSGKPFGRKCIFCQSGKATNGSYLRFLQKSIFEKKLAAHSRNRLKITAAKIKKITRKSVEIFGLSH